MTKKKNTRASPPNKLHTTHGWKLHQKIRIFRSKSVRWFTNICSHCVKNRPIHTVKQMIFPQKAGVSFKRKMDGGTKQD